MAARSGLSAPTIGRIWKAFRLQPHRSETFKLSTDPLFVDKVFDVVGLYLNPPEGAIVPCRVERVALPGGEVTWTVLGADYCPVGPAEQYLEFLRSQAVSPNTVKSYARGLALWWSTLRRST